MRFTDYMRLGLKNLWRSKTRSFLTIFAVIIGTISVVIMLSLVIGAKNVATKQIEGIGGFTLIAVNANPDMEYSGDILSTNQNGDTTKKLNDTTLAYLKKINHVLDATPLANLWVNYVSLAGQEKKFNPNIVAFTPGTNVLNIDVKVGRKLQQGDTDRIIIGTRLLKSLGYSSNPNDIIGKKLLLFSQGYNDGGIDPPRPPENAGKEYWDEINSKSHPIEAEIIGVADSTDDGQNYITLDWAKRLMTTKHWQWVENKSDVPQNGNNFRNNILVIEKRDNIAERGYASIIVKVDNTANVETVSNEILKLGLGTQTAKEMLEQITKLFRIIGLIIGAIGGIALFVATIGIINTMIMATYERTREIGILRAFGATKSTIKNLFVFEAAMIGFWGGVFGVIISYGLAKIGNTIGNKIAIAQSIPINNLISFPPSLIIGVVSLTTVIGALAGLFPAIRAARLDPVEALRYE